VSRVQNLGAMILGPRLAAAPQGRVSAILSSVLYLTKHNMRLETRPCGAAAKRVTVAVLLANLLLYPNPTRAQVQWRLTTADFQSSTIDLQRIDDKNVHGLTPAGEDHAVPLDQLLEVSRPLAAHTDAGSFTLFLQGGDRVEGEPGAMTGEQLQWHSAELGDFHLPLRNIIAIGVAGSVPPEQRPTDDVVSLTNNDQVHGIITAMDGTKVSVQTENGNTDVPLTSVKLIAFAAAAGKRQPHQSFRISLDDGTAIAAQSISLDGNALHFTIPGNAPGTIDLAHVGAIEQINGPVSWLSVRPPSENVYLPFISPGQTWPARMDRSVIGDALRFRDQTFAHGIGVHAYSRLSWPLEGAWTAFRTQYAIDGDDAEALAADVTVRIKLDGKVVYEQPHVHGGELSPVIVQQLEAAKTLTLEVDFGDRMDTRARLNWIEPALVKNAPTPMVQTTPPTTIPTTAQ
jgi:hypothetical protein